MEGHFKPILPTQSRDAIYRSWIVEVSTALRYELLNVGNLKPGLAPDDYQGLRGRLKVRQIPGLRSQPKDV